MEIVGASGVIGLLTDGSGIATLAQMVVGRPCIGRASCHQTTRSPDLAECDAIGLDGRRRRCPPSQRRGLSRAGLGEARPERLIGRCRQQPVGQRLVVGRVDQNRRVTGDLGDRRRRARDDDRADASASATGRPNPS